MKLLKLTFIQWRSYKHLFPHPPKKNWDKVIKIEHCDVTNKWKIYSSEDFLKQRMGKNVGWRQNLKVEYCLKSEEENDDIVNAHAGAFPRCSQDVCLESLNNVHENKIMT